MSKAKKKMSNPAPSGKIADGPTELITQALKRAAKEARRLAKLHGTKLWVMKDGKVVGLEP